MNAKKFHIYIKYILGVQYLFKYDRVSTLDFFMYLYFYILRVSMQNSVLYSGNFSLRLCYLIDLG